MSALATNTVTNVESEDAPALWRSLGSSVGSGRPRSAEIVTFHIVKKVIITHGN